MRKRYPDWAFRPPLRKENQDRAVFATIEEYDNLVKNTPWTLRERFDRIRIVWWQFTHLVWLFDLIEKKHE